MRLWLRRRTIEWDDRWAAVSLLALVCQMVGLFCQLPDAGTSEHCNQTVSVTLIFFDSGLLHEINSILHDCLVRPSTHVHIIPHSRFSRSARLAIIFSVRRFTPRIFPAYRKYLLAAAAIFVVFCGVLIGQIFWLCPDAYKKEGPGCTKECARQFAISQLIGKYSNYFAWNIWISSAGTI